ncbi:MAG: CoA transferase [Proteobacteria bacterium]|nr:CoA transferase [Pseudomonadota bacterium]
MTAAPLDGIRVLDLSRVLAGPWCSMTLADMGADVIKIESLEGDDTRSWGPPFIERGNHKLSAYFSCVNRNKRSVAVNLKDPKGQDIVHRLARQADVLLENFKTGGAEKLGVGYEQLRTENPALVYCSISGYGRTGSKAHVPGYDFIIQAEAGLMSITGPSGGKPYKVGMAVADITTGMNATTGILAALFARTRSGKGQHIDISLYDTQLQWLGNVASNVLFSGHDARRWGNNHANIVPYQMFEAAENTWLVVACGNDGQWRHLCTILGKPEWQTDPKYATNPARVTNRDDLTPMLQKIFLTRPAAAWLKDIDAAGIPCGHVRTVKEAIDDPLTTERGMRLHMHQPVLDTDIPLLGSALHFSETPVRYHSAPPVTGQHTEEVLGELGLSRDDIRALERDKIIGL